MRFRDYGRGMRYGRCNVALPITDKFGLGILFAYIMLVLRGVMGLGVCPAPGFFMVGKNWKVGKTLALAIFYEIVI